MMDVQGLKSYVREQMDVDQQDLPDSVLDVYLQEAFDRTMAFSNRWPRTEYTWLLTKIEGEDFVSLPEDLNLPSIISLVAAVDGYPIIQTTQEIAESRFAPTNALAGVGQPIYFTIWGNQMYLWPRVATENHFALVLRGHRQPVWSSAASSIPDLDPRLHVTLAYFALSLAYIQQEDEVMEGIYLGRWQRDLQQQLKMIMEPNHSRPLVLHGGSPIGGVPGFVINPPVG